MFDRRIQKFPWAGIHCPSTILDYLESKPELAQHSSLMQHKLSTTSGNSLDSFIRFPSHLNPNTTLPDFLAFCDHRCWRVHVQAMLLSATVYSCVAECHRLYRKFKVRGLLYFLSGWPMGAPLRFALNHSSNKHLNSYVLSIYVNACSVECLGDGP